LALRRQGAVACGIGFALLALAIASKQGHQGLSTEPGARRMPRDTSTTGAWGVLSQSQHWEERRISRAEFGNRWPFTVGEGLLRCEGQAVTFTSGGTTYAINGTALSRMKVEPTWREAREVWAREPNPQLPGVDLRKDISPIINLGLTLCG
jgi:hypothetical protein